MTTLVMNRDVLLELLNEKQATAARKRYEGLSWIKFILTDDKPNGNGQRIPQEEFSNLIRTGALKPVKMALGGPADGHEGAFPLGVITNLRKEDDKILAIAALWSFERPEEVSFIRECIENKVPVTLSWEIYYEDSKQEDETETLYGTSLRAVTIVRVPAYGQRTRVLEMASLEDSEGDMNEEELKGLQEENERLKEEVLRLQNENKALKQEISELREYKERMEALLEKQAKIERVKAIFTMVGVTRPDEFFEENYEKFSSMDDAAIEFFARELASFAKASLDVPVPPMVKSSITYQDLVEFLSRGGM